MSHNEHIKHTREVTSEGMEVKSSEVAALQ